MKRNNRITLVLAIVLSAANAFPQPATMLERALNGIRSIKTLSCAIVRKQTYKGFNKTASCIFYHDRQKGKFAYVYASPFDYSFWVDNAGVCGVNRNNMRGYNATLSADSSNYRFLLESIHVCGPLFQFERLDTVRVSLKASIDDFLYFEYPVAVGREVLKIDKKKNVILMIETLDPAGAVMSQTMLEYETTKRAIPLFPRKIITRRNPTGSIQTDTLLFTRVEINKKINESVFVPPAFAAIDIGK